MLDVVGATVDVVLVEDVLVELLGLAVDGGSRRALVAGRLAELHAVTVRDAAAAVAARNTRTPTAE